MDAHGTDDTDLPLMRRRLSEIDLSGMDLTDEEFEHAIMTFANLAQADLTGVSLEGADLIAANLTSANLNGANLQWADLRDARLEGANLTDANLSYANLSGARLKEANLHGAILHDTVLGNTDLTEAKGLSECIHEGPSVMDHQTLQRSGMLPLPFLRGMGLAENLIDYLPSLLNQPVQFYSCFISYSAKDQDFADRFHAGLQNKGVRCWFAPHDLPIGAKTWDTIDEAIRLRDKVLLILSENAIASDWVEDEVTKAFAEERERKQVMLFPIRLDDVVMQTSEPWARKLRDQRNIGSFIGWKDHDSYQKSFERVLRDLKLAHALKS